jgi:hypothetical protein
MRVVNNDAFILKHFINDAHYLNLNYLLMLKSILFESDRELAKS